MSVLRYRAWALQGLGRDTEALSYLARAISLDDAYEFALAMRGRLRGEAGRHAEAQQDFDQALSEHPSTAVVPGGPQHRPPCTHSGSKSLSTTSPGLSISSSVSPRQEARSPGPSLNCFGRIFRRTAPPLTPTVRLAALLTHQVQWPGLIHRAGSVPGPRPSPGMLTGGLRLTAAPRHHRPLRPIHVRRRGHSVEGLTH